MQQMRSGRNSFDMQKLSHLNVNCRLANNSEKDKIFLEGSHVFQAQGFNTCNEHWPLHYFLFCGGLLCVCVCVFVFV